MKARHEVWRLFWTLFFALFLPILLVAPHSESQSPKAIKTDEEAMRDLMVVWSRQLGVTCTTCHDTSNFKNSDKREYKISREHQRMTQTLIDQGFDGKKGPKADCYMCHRGQMKPDYKEKIDALIK